MKARSLGESFRFALDGAAHALRSERNMRIHVVAAVVVISGGLIVGVDRTGLALLLLTVAVVICAELFNTALEALIDWISPDYHPAAGVAKNVAAAAVLVPAVVSTAVGYVVFRDYLPSGLGVLLGAGLAIGPRVIPGSGRDTRRLAQMNRFDPEALVDAARQVRERAYVPYSGFKVGAALLTAGGRIITGCNVENASFGATICAERTAVVTALAAGEREFVAMAVIADSDGPVTPCGICRQVLAEFAPDMPVVMANTRGARMTMTVRELLPGMFELPEAGSDGQAHG